MGLEPHPLRISGRQPPAVGQVVGNELHRVLESFVNEEGVERLSGGTAQKTTEIQGRIIMNGFIEFKITASERGYVRKRDIMLIRSGSDCNHTEIKLTNGETLDIYIKLDDFVKLMEQKEYTTIQ